ncbi:hypothetical protein JYU34_002123 [Plutella xylostella]|uniref:Uncharacterized protein n=1 Tax=Plutella xylostella TaxID=51655 RepID=A0ABQ7R1F9_PLUXY|nr:hypothetical protein JYU34_002123 [Plutella xylostella]
MSDNAISFTSFVERSSDNIIKRVKKERSRLRSTRPLRPGTTSSITKRSRKLNKLGISRGRVIMMMKSPSDLKETRTAALKKILNRQIESINDEDEADDSYQVSDPDNRQESQEFIPTSSQKHKKFNKF